MHVFFFFNGDQAQWNYSMEHPHVVHVTNIAYDHACLLRKIASSVLLYSRYRLMLHDVYWRTDCIMHFSTKHCNYLGEKKNTLHIFKENASSIHLFFILGLKFLVLHYFEEVQKWAPGLSWYLWKIQPCTTISMLCSHFVSFCSFPFSHSSLFRVLSFSSQSLSHSLTSSQL